MGDLGPGCTRRAQLRLIDTQESQQLHASQMNQFHVPLQSAATALCLAGGLLSGCGTAPASRIQDRAELDGAKACCQSISALPLPAQLNDQTVVLFAKDSTHFDFGRGLTPFARFAIDGNESKYLTIIASCRGSGLAFGGDGMNHCVDVKVTFLDSTGSALRHSSTAPTLRDYNSKMFNLTTFHNVPASAKTVLITADPSQMGSEGSAPGRYTAYGTNLTVSAGRQIPYVRTVYGSITSIVGPTLEQASRGLSN